MRILLGPFLWCAVAILGAGAFGVLGYSRGEPVNAFWLVAAALCSYALAYRFYGRWIGRSVLRVDSARPTPAIRLNDGLDYAPTNPIVLFGHHFAAIAGAGPLVGPVLAAQMGYLPGALWILAGAILAGAVQDCMVLFFSVRRDGRSLGEMIREEFGAFAGVIALLGVFLILIILLAVLAFVVVKALSASPWGVFTVLATIPLALIMGVYGRYIRPGRIAEMSVIGFSGLVAALILGQKVAESPELAVYFTFSAQTVTLLLIAYGFIAAILPIWLLLAPRDYLSTFLKIGAIGAIAIGVALILPQLKMAPVTRFIDGTGPVFSGSLFPFLFITIACGAVSGFHSLISSGTTPKMIENETQIPFIGYGAMLMESCVAIMALTAASTLEPGVYFAMNSPAALIGATPDSAASVISGWGFPLTADALLQTARDVGETTLLSRTGGAPTFSLGMATLFSQIIGGSAFLGFWYHFAILFEALFILTALDAGTRVCRFMAQDLIGMVFPAFRETSAWGPNIAATTATVSAWGYFLYMGVTDPLGGINTLWPLFGISNQMLAVIALILCSTFLVKAGRGWLALTAIGPAAWVGFCTMTAAWQKAFSENPAIGFFAQARRFSTALNEGRLLAPAGDFSQMRQVIFNNYIDGGLILIFMGIVCALTVSASLSIRKKTLNAVFDHVNPSDSERRPSHA